MFGITFGKESSFVGENIELLENFHRRISCSAVPTQEKQYKEGKTMYTFNNTQDDRMERAKQILAMFYCSDRSHGIECHGSDPKNRCHAENCFEQKAA